MFPHSVIRVDELIIGRMVTVDTKARDTCRHVVATVGLGRKNINIAMITLDQTLYPQIFMLRT